MLLHFLPRGTSPEPSEAEVVGKHRLSSVAGGKSRTVAFCRQTFWVHADVARGMKQAIDRRGQPDEGEKGKGVYDESKLRLGQSWICIAGFWISNGRRKRLMLHDGPRKNGWRRRSCLNENENGVTGKPATCVTCVRLRFHFFVISDLYYHVVLSAFVMFFSFFKTSHLHHLHRNILVVNHELYSAVA